MKYLKWYAWSWLLFYDPLGYASTLVADLALPEMPDAPASVLRKLIQSDMKGDADERVGLAAKEFKMEVADCNQMLLGSAAFSLGDGGMVIATSWRFDDYGYPCSGQICTLGVVYRVVGTTKGCGAPTWDSAKEWDIVPLPKAVERTMKYTLWRINGTWKIRRFLPPYVSPEAMKDFYVEAFKQSTSLPPLPATADPRAKKNRELRLDWERRQLDLIERLPK
jgi:hypothetical protein